MHVIDQLTLLKQLFEVPSNLLLAKVKPGRYLGVITVIWGLITTLTGLVHNYRDLLVCRVLLGVFEAGLFPGLVSYLTLFYNRKQLALRIGSLFSSSALAGVLGGIMAYGMIASL
jgi:MFS family permease